MYKLHEATLVPRLKLLETLRDNGGAASRTALAKMAGGRKETALRSVSDLILEGAVTEHHGRLTIAPIWVKGTHRRGGSRPGGIAGSRTDFGSRSSQ